MKDTKKEFNPHLIRTKQMKIGKWSAYVTWGYDYQEYGKTESEAVTLLVTKHAKAFGLTDVKSALNSIGFYPDSI